MSDLAIWATILGLWAVTYLIRISFLLLFAGRELPGGVMRALALVPVTVLPALVAPMVLRPDGGAGAIDPAELAAVAVTLALGLGTRNVLAGMVGGITTFVAVNALV